MIVQLPGAELVRLIRAADIFHVQNRFLRKHGVKLQEYPGDVPVKVIDMQVCHQAPACSLRGDASVR